MVDESFAASFGTALRFLRAGLQRALIAGYSAMLECLA